MRHISIVFIVLIILCTLISCGLPSSFSTLKSEKAEKIEIVAMRIIDSFIYTTKIQELFESRHYAVIAIIHSEVHGGYVDSSQYKTEYPLEIPDTTCGEYPVYNAGDTIDVKMTEHRKQLEEGRLEILVAHLHTEVVFIGFCTEGSYKLNVNGFEKEFNVGNIN